MPETDITFRSAGATLAGTITRPHVDRSVPGVLILAGSGPLDRDGNHRRLRLDISRQLAVALHDAGLASLRYDKRGAGASSGTFLATGLHDNVADARAALDTLRARPGVDPDRLFVLGHSEGAVVTIALLAGDTPPVAGAVLLSPTARSGAEVLRWQADQVAHDLPAPVGAVLRLLRVDLRARVARNHERLRASTGDVVRLGGVRVNARWFREFMAYDPMPDLARLGVPVLALAGGKDLQAPPQDLDVIGTMLGDRARTVLIDDLSHILRSQPGPATLRSYRRDVVRPVDTRVLTAVVDWLGQH
ncbi:alpha/beta hydrolase family protein [Micromonospora endolithica]|uniref:Alpha/beta hydrolase n=1 Tax=Micromonospora endolithica TaxID=230091 RepID=A0A3A9Z826_9ACTN|nr:alpha/beta fold hydrolase [Micromonospora endolithica]RKN43487.1 alpha/beta hydrolase [Micromonospora endolithica]TWJ24071.1 hypothetical protein JD76_04217 [Micromonospora endolithica]